MITGLVADSLGGGLSASGVFFVRSAVTITWSVSTPPADVARFELISDGGVATTLPGTARTGTVRLTPGPHTIQVRAVHVSGAAAVTPVYRVLADAIAPTFPSPPSPALRTGAYSATSVPITVDFRAADNARLSTVTATAPVKVNLPTTDTRWYASVAPGVATTYSLTARDVPGNTRTASVSRMVNLLAETAGKKTGTWITRTAAVYLGGRGYAATTKNAELTYTFTGRSAALLFSRGPQTGAAYVYLDGKKVATIDTRSATPLYQQGLWASPVAAGKHTISIVVAGTTGHPTVIADGLAYIP
jgi:hypothetical protein